MVRKLVRRSVEKFMETAPVRGPAPQAAADLPWRAITSMAGTDTPECYEASARADLIIAKARRVGGANWQEVALAESRKEPNGAQQETVVSDPPQDEAALVPDSYVKWERACFIEQQKTWREQEIVATQIWEALRNIRDRAQTLCGAVDDLMEQIRALKTNTNLIEEARKSREEVRRLEARIRDLSGAGEIVP